MTVTLDSNLIDQQRMADLIAQAKRFGADAAEVAVSSNRSLGVGIRKGALENIEADETCDLGVRVFCGQKSASATVSEFSKTTLDRLLERLVAMAKASPDDVYAGLAEKDALYSGEMDGFDGFDAPQLTAQQLKDRARELEALGLNDPRLSSDGASCGHSESQWAMMTSAGFYATAQKSVHYQSLRLIATSEDGAMERDGEGRSTRHFSDLPSLSDTAQLAAKRALSALGARKIESKTCHVLFDERVSKSLIGQFLGAISGPSLARGTSFLKDAMGKAVFAKGVSISDDPFRPRGMASSRFDDEGLPTVARNLIDDGVLTTWLLNLASSRQLGLAPTGHGSRGLVGPAGASAHNVVLNAGKSSVSDLLKDAKSGLIVTSMFGPNVNADTGDWSAGASGFWFEGGEKAYAVNEITVAGNLKDMFARLTPASDLVIKGALDAPSFLIEGLKVGGK